MLKSFKSLLTAAALVLSAVSFNAQAEEYVAGKDYKVLPTPVPVMANGKIHVEEAFWYGCPHCYQLEAYGGPWKKTLPADVDFKQVPASFGRAWAIHAHLFYAAENLGVMDKVHNDIFKAIHVQRERLLEQDDQIQFFKDRGVSAEDAKKALNSFTVKSRVKQADKRVRSFQVDGVPAIIVNGKYMVNASSAGGTANVTKVVDFLIKKERSGK